MQIARCRVSQRTAAMLMLAIVIAGCGSSSKKSSTVAATGSPGATPPSLALSISETGTSAKYAGPASIKGGLVTVQLTNNGHSPHSAQLIRIVGAHTVEEAFKSLGSESRKTPSWLRAEGGVGGALPGSGASATMSLPAGNYVVIDFAGAQQAKGPPAITPLTVTPGAAGVLPSTATTITAAAPSKDHYRWEISGPLKVGANQVTFVSKGRSALHEVAAVRITGNESIAQLVKALETNGPPPSYVDQESKDQTAVLDGGKSLTTRLTLAKPGTYVFFCHLTDRSGGKPHFAEGMITTVTVK